MWSYQKKLQYPVNIKNANPKLAQCVVAQYGGPNGELGASMRYLTQRYGQPFDEVKGILTDVGTEELAHLEMICAMVHQLTRNLNDSQIQDSAFAPYFVDNTTGVYPTAASGFREYDSNNDAYFDLWCDDVSVSVIYREGEIYLAFHAHATEAGVELEKTNPDLYRTYNWQIESEALAELFEEYRLTADEIYNKAKETIKIKTYTFKSMGSNGNFSRLI